MTTKIQAPSDDKETNLFIAVCGRIDIAKASFQEICELVLKLRTHEDCKVSDEGAFRVMKRLEIFKGK